jgi:enamine deaminase RidA (YjgF/YER057c/UK114 family)
MKVLPTIVDTAANLTALNEIIPDGVLCKESKSNRFKVGDGVHKYSALPYVADEALTIANQALTTANNTFTNLNNLLPPTIDSSPLSHSTKLGDILLQCGKSPANNAQSAQIQGDIAVEVKDILSTYPETKYI